MKLTLLGTGSILTSRLSACSVIDESILIDTPNGSVKAARRAGIDPGSLSAALITHFHADHFFDVVFLLLELGLRQTREEEFLLVGPTGLEGRVRQLFELAYPESQERVLANSKVRFVEVDPEGINLAIGPYDVRAVEVKHTTPRALGYRVSNGSASIGFSGDSEICPAIDDLCATSQLAVMDASFLNGRSGHMGYDDVLSLAKRYGECTLVATHMSDEVSVLESTAVLIPVDGQVVEL